PVGMGTPRQPGKNRHVTPTPEVAKYAPKGPLSVDPASAPYGAVLGEGFLGVGVGPAHPAVGAEKTRTVGGKKVETVRTSYLLPFEIVSVHLLVVLIGAAYLARAKRRRGATPP